METSAIMKSSEEDYTGDNDTESLDSVEEDTVIDLNVGGKLFSTLKSTLMKETGSKLAEMVNGNSAAKLDSSGRYFIDCDPEMFDHILKYLRIGKLPPYEHAIDVYEHAKYFHLNTLQAILEQFKMIKGKINGDKAKRSIDKDKYEALKQDISRVLTKHKENECEYISIVTAGATSFKMFRMCSCKQKVASLGDGRFIYADALKPAIITELEYNDKNLIRAIASDLKSFGYGTVRYNVKYVCDSCHTCCLRIMIIENSSDTDPFIISRWKSV